MPYFRDKYLGFNNFKFFSENIQEYYNFVQPYMDFYHLLVCIFSPFVHQEKLSLSISLKIN